MPMEDLILLNTVPVALHDSVTTYIISQTCHIITSTNDDVKINTNGNHDKSVS